MQIHYWSDYRRLNLSKSGFPFKNFIGGLKPNFRKIHGHIFRNPASRCREKNDSLRKSLADMVSARVCEVCDDDVEDDHSQRF